MINCPVCTEKSFLIWRERQYSAYRCEKCGVAFLHPFPVNPAEIYSEDYFRRWYISYFEERNAYLEQLFPFIEEYAGKKGKLMDTGCGAGIFLTAAKERGWDVCGQDVSPFAVDYCRKKGFEVYDGPLPELNLPKNSFDLITMLDVIAHLKEPAAYVETCGRLLKPGGCLVIKTPNHPKFLFYIARLLSFTGKSRALLHVPAQIFHFNENSLKAMCSAGGFKLLKINMMEDFSSLRRRGFIHIMLKCAGADKSLASFWRKE